MNVVGTVSVQVRKLALAVAFFVRMGTVRKAVGKMKVGIIGAEDGELAPLKEDLTAERRSTLLGMDFCEGLLGTMEVVVVRCGTGKVHAALCAFALIERFGVDAIVNTGAAGALDGRLRIGDIVVSDDLVQHDMDVSGLGYEIGQIPDVDCFAFKADERLKDLVVQAVRQVAPEVNVYVGRIATGDVFVSDAKAKDAIAQRFGALCAEMEGAAVAQACHLARVPFVVIRAISDQADGGANVDFPTFRVEVGDRSARIVEKAVARLLS